jgi:hypothetical protein
VVHRLDQALYGFLEYGKIDDECALRVYIPFDADANPVIVAMEGLALVAGERDEVGAGKGEVILAYRNLETVPHVRSPDEFRWNIGTSGEEDRGTLYPWLMSLI